MMSNRYKGNWKKWPLILWSSKVKTG